MAHIVTASSNTAPFTVVRNDKLAKSEQNQRELRQRFMAASHFSQQEISAFEIDTKESFERFWHSTIAAKRDFDARHDHGLARVAGKATKFANSAVVAWSAIAPILDIVKDVGSPSSGVAIGTIAFMFTIAQNRERMEIRIGATLKSIQDRLPGIETYRRIYQTNGEPDERLKSTIIDAYDCFIEFCIATVTFYTMSGFSRWLKAIGRSSSLDEKAWAVEQAIVNVRLVCEELLNKNVADVKSLNEEQAKQIERLSKQVEELQRGHDGQRLDLIGALLKLSPHSPEAELATLKRHRENIVAEFNNWYSRQRRPKAPLASITDHQTFQSWCTSAGSRILVLIGRNRVLQARNCWLSPVALDFIAESKLSRPRDPCVFYILGRSTADDTFGHVASSLIYRLLSINREVLRNETQYAELQAELQSFESATRTGSEPHVVGTSLRKVALRVLNMFSPSTTVWMILDRLDECRGQGSRNLHRKALLKFLVKLVEDENLGVRLRVLAVVNGVDWRLEEQHDEIDRTKDESIKLWTLEQAQHV
ncbi:hypothetical protein F5Y14DRAFT_462432 [Nemania sp. NC0429]|nr:hypothetical protein F5Y14DRAFT_462432 [Nemania sp. NC0429]